MGVVSKQRENGTTKNTYTQNQEKVTEIPWIHNEKGGHLGISNTRDRVRQGGT